jgi:hypothetical protein
MQVLRRIDRGGFGFVDEVILDNGTPGARKCFDPQLVDPNDRSQLRRRFEREVRIQSAIAHPNIIPVLGASLADEPPWFTMPLASMSLEHKIASDHAAAQFDSSPWPDILSAVEELHRLGYVHRDLKPANILCVGGVWMVSDFGLILPTKRETTVLTRSGSAYGSRNYAAPEQAVDFRHTPEQADIYAIGCVLHDATDASPYRIPFAQIRASGPYAPLLEKCTEIDPRRRFPTVASLRAALFDLWAAAAAPSAGSDEGELLALVLATPASAELWRRLLNYLENQDLSVRNILLRSINAEHIVALHGVDDVLFARLLDLLCTWASGTSFEFSYCDVLGDRLLEAYRIANIRIRCQIVLATLELAVSHNRWHVMSHAGAMLGSTADNGLVDRILIEVTLDARLESQLRDIEKIIHWRRNNWHERIAVFLNSREAA